MAEIKFSNRYQEKFYNELEKDYHNFEKSSENYGQELCNLWYNKLQKTVDRLMTTRRQLLNDEKLKSKHPTIYNQFQNKLAVANSEIEKHTKNLRHADYTFHHKEHLNSLAGIIDTYENKSIELIKELSSTLVDEKNVAEEKKNVEDANSKKEYVKIEENWIYTLTKNTNYPKIHEVLNTIIHKDEIWKIDYSGCTNTNIKNKMASAISTSNKYWPSAKWIYSCYLQYDEAKKTYVISDWDWNILPYRALIREWVQLTPPSKIKWEAKKVLAEAEKAKAEKAESTNLSQQEQSDLLNSMPLKLKEALPSNLLTEFFDKTENDIINRIKEAKSEHYELASKAVSKGWYTTNWDLLKIHLINWQAETSRSLITSKLSDPLFKILDSHESELVQYMTARINQKRQQLDYLTKKESTIHKVEGRKLEKEERDNARYWLDLLWTRADNVFNSIGNTRLKDDDHEFAAIKTHIRNAINDLDNPHFSEKNLQSVENELFTMINTFFQNNLKWKCPTLQKELHTILTWNKNEIITSIRIIWWSRTIFDNTDTTHLRDEITKDITEENIDMKDDNYEQYFKNIFKLYEVKVPQNDKPGEESNEESVKIPEDKKQNIDELYAAAHGNENQLLKFLQDKELLPKETSKALKEKVKELKTTLNQQEKFADNFSITGKDIKDRTEIQAANLKSKSSLTPEEKKILNTYNFMLEQDDDFFNTIATEEQNSTKEALRYMWIENSVKSKIAPFLIKKWWWIQDLKNSSNNAMYDIYNDSVWAWGAFDRSDENCAKIWPVLIDIIVEVVVTAVSIALSWNWAWDAIYASFRAAKAAIDTCKWIQKIIKFITAFMKNLWKILAKQYAGKFSVSAWKFAKNVAASSRIVKWSETFWSVVWKLAMKWTSLVVEWTMFHINSTIIHNAINGNNLWEWLSLSWYTEWPNWEKIPNRKSYAQSIAFLWVLKWLWKTIQTLNGKMVQAILKDSMSTSVAAKALTNSLSLAWEMGSMLWTDQILSFTFDQKFKTITCEDLISMFWMIVWLRLSGKVNLKIQEYDKKSVSVELKQWDNTFNVKVDSDGNVLKIEWKDKNWWKIKNPSKSLGIQAWINWSNIRDINQAQTLDKTGTIKWSDLKNLQEWDAISIKRWDKTLTFEKNGEWKRELSNLEWQESEWLTVGEEFSFKENSDWSWYHLESNTPWRAKIALDGKVNVKLSSRELPTHTTIEKMPTKQWAKEFRYDSKLSETEQTKLAEDFENLLTSNEWIKINGDIYKMETWKKDSYTIYKNWKKVATCKLAKWFDSVSNEFISTYNEIRTEYLVEKETEILLSDRFSKEIWSEQWIKIWDINYKMEYLTDKVNSFTWRKWLIRYTETDTKTWRTKKTSTPSDSREIPNNSKWNDIQQYLNTAKDSYIKENYASELESARQGIKEFDIGSRNKSGTKISFPRSLEPNELSKFLTKDWGVITTYIKENWDIVAEKTYPNWEIHKWDFDANRNLVSWIKYNPNWWSLFWTFDNMGRLTIGCISEKVEEWYKQTYITLDGVFNVSLDNNFTVISAIKEWDSTNSVNIDAVSSLNQIFQNWKWQSMQDMIDSRYNNYKITAELKKLSNQYKRLERQSKAFESIEAELNIKNVWLDRIQLQLKKIPEWMRSETIKKILTYKDITEVSSNDIKRLQRELGFSWDDITGIFWIEAAKILSSWDYAYKQNIIYEFQSKGIHIETLNKFILRLSNKQISSLRDLSNLWVDICRRELLIQELSEYTSEQINTLKERQQIWVDISDPRSLKFLLRDFSPDNINKIKQLKDIWLDIKDPNNLWDLTNLTSKQVNTLKKLKDIWLNFSQSLDTKDINSYSKIVIRTFEKMWISLEYSAAEFIDLVTTHITKNDIIMLKRITDLWIKINSIRRGSSILSASINWENIDITNETVSAIEKLKRLWIELTSYTIKNIELITSKEAISKLTAIKNFWIELSDTVIANLESFISKSDIRKYQTRKLEYLKQHQTLANQDFNSLFRVDGRKNKTWKYWIWNIYQTGLWYCYAYTWFELLKKSNIFETLIKTSMKKTSNGWEIKMPLWDPNGHTIKVNNNEINKKFSFTDKEEWTKRNVNINSDSSMWFKILEIAFIKEYIINNNEYSRDPIAIKAREEFKKAWDITLTWELLNLVEWWRTSEFFEHIIWKNIIKTGRAMDKNQKLNAIKLIQLGNFKIDLDIPNDQNEQKDQLYKLTTGEQVRIAYNHAYSIENMFHDNTLNMDMVTVVNPRFTDKSSKITMSVNDCINIFQVRNISSIDINKIF